MWLVSGWGAAGAMVVALVAAAAVGSMTLRWAVALRVARAAVDGACSVSHRGRRTEDQHRSSDAGKQHGATDDVW